MPNSLKYRRRQVYLGVFVLLLSVFSVAEGVYFRHQDKLQRQCIERSFADLSAALQVRADLIEQDSAMNNKAWMVYADAAGVVRDDPTKPLPPKVLHHYQRRLVRTLLEYRRVERRIAQARDDNAIPPFPVGRCSND